jgi:thioesterase domain-containing protein/acyl carrier protein
MTRAPAQKTSSAQAESMLDLLIKIWSRTLQAPDVHPESDFFELGGDSLLAVNLFLEIEQATGRNFPITAIYDAPTVAQLATLIAQEEASRKFSPLVLVQDGGRGVPLFIVHGVGGTVLDLAAVGRQIDSDGPVYLVQARGIDGQDTPLTTIEEMADYYVEALREAAPRGPWRLVGYSFGGMVAVEMARRLSPENVEALILLDAFAHPQTWPTLSRLQVKLAKVARRLREKAKQPPLQILASVRARLNRRLSRCAPAKEDRLVALRDWLGTVRADLPAPLREARIAGSKALLAYRPSFYPGKVTFLRAGTTGDTFPANARWVWQHQVAALELRTIAGSHASIVNEHAASTAKAISACIAPTVARPAAVSRRSSETTLLLAQVP